MVLVLAAVFQPPPAFFSSVAGRFFLAGVMPAETTILAFFALAGFLPGCEMGGSTVIVAFWPAAAAGAAVAGAGAAAAVDAPEVPTAASTPTARAASVAVAQRCRGRAGDTSGASPWTADGAPALVGPIVTRK